MLMPGRRFSSSTYRFGFNGKENDNNVKGEGNEQDYGMRIYDSRIGKFLSVDPLTKIYPELTPFQFSSNRPIDGVDLDGLERYDYKLLLNTNSKPKLVFQSVSERMPTLTEAFLAIFGYNNFSGKKYDFSICVNVERNGVNTNTIFFKSFKEFNLWQQNGYSVGEVETIDTQAGDQAALMFMMMTLEQNIDLADRDVDGYTQPSFNSAKENPSNGINKQSISANKGNTAAAESNSEATKNLQVGKYNAMTKANKYSGLSADHIPSFAAIKKYTESQLGRQLTSEEANILRQNSLTLVYETKLHQTMSRTYGGRNSKSIIIADAKNLKNAIMKDLETLTPGLLKLGYSKQDISNAQNALIKGLEDPK